jgi:hypothetical protein
MMGGKSGLVKKNPGDGPSNTAVIKQSGGWWPGRNEEATGSQLPGTYAEFLIESCVSPSSKYSIAIAKKPAMPIGDNFEEISLAI